MSVDIIGYGNASPSTKKLRRDLIQWIGSLDPTSIILTKDANSLPMHVWKCEEWEIQFEAIPIRPDAEQRPRRPIGALIGGARLGNSWEPIRDAILNKGTRYGDLDAPLLVAVNADAFNIDRDDEMQALFGGDQVTRYPDKQSQLTRARNGAWFGPGGPRCTRVAGVWIFNDITPRSIAERRGTLYFNPYRDFSLPQELTRFSHAVAVDREIERREGVSLREALNLPINWPSV